MTLNTPALAGLIFGLLDCDVTRGFLPRRPRHRRHIRHPEHISLLRTCCDHAHHQSSGGDDGSSSSSSHRRSSRSNNKKDENQGRQANNHTCCSVLKIPRTYRRCVFLSDPPSLGDCCFCFQPVSFTFVALLNVLDEIGIMTKNRGRQTYVGTVSCKCRFCVQGLQGLCQRGQKSPQTKK